MLDNAGDENDPRTKLPGGEQGRAAPVSRHRAPQALENGHAMKGYMLRDKEVEDEAKRAREAKNQGQWIAGCWESQADGGLKWIRPKFIPGPAA